MLRLDHILIRQDDFSLSADWTIQPGQRTALIGASGAGKSTLLSTIAGFLAPTEGRVLWEGRDLSDLPPGDRPLSILFQDQNLFPHLSVAQNLGLGLRPDLRLSPAQTAAVETTLDQVGLAGLGARRPGQLSGGQIARAALARALLRARPLLLLDEPFAALGPALRSEMLALVRDLTGQGGITLIMVTHDPDDARAIADQTVLISDGVALPPAPTAALFADPPPALRAYLGG